MKKSLGMYLIESMASGKVNIPAFLIFLLLLGLILVASYFIYGCVLLLLDHS